MPKYSVRRPYTILVGVVLIIVLGAVSLLRMTTDLLPDMNLPYVLVITRGSGEKCHGPHRGADGDNVEHQDHTVHVL